LSALGVASARLSPPLSRSVDDEGRSRIQGLDHVNPWAGSRCRIESAAASNVRVSLAPRQPPWVRRSQHGSAILSVHQARLSQSSLSHSDGARIPCDVGCVTSYPTSRAQVGETKRVVADCGTVCRFRGRRREEQPNITMAVVARLAPRGRKETPGRSGEWWGIDPCRCCVCGSTPRVRPHWPRWPALDVETALASMSLT
jgi:hypothetical protein